jgi:periplasmic protein TonB
VGVDEGPSRVNPMQRLQDPAFSAAIASAARPAAGAEIPAPLDKPLFSGVLDPGRSGRLAPLAVSVTVHTVLTAVLVLVPLLLPEAMIETPQTDVFRALIYDPPPPPPPPLPKGSADEGRHRMLDAPPTPQPAPVSVEARLEAPVETVAAPVEPNTLPDGRAGSPAGSESGVPEGMEEGVPGGVVGGVPGGVVGGVIGGTGTGPVPPLVYDYDRPPRLLNPAKPRYPPDAFVRKVEGVVVVEFVIDSTGRVVRARIVQSIPLLDPAALETVRGWVFAPALKGGRPVATIARSPVTFRIF